MVWFYLPLYWWEKNLAISFQSHYGLILSATPHEFYVFVLMLFNPTMVWFYREKEGKNSYELAIFNPTMVWFYLSCFLIYTFFHRLIFNPTMVWFYRQRRRYDRGSQNLFSIPLWSDFIPFATPSLFIISVFQSHYGLILSKWCWKTYNFCRQFSIPLWSDFIFVSPFFEVSCSSFSIPLWSDFINR